MKIEISEKAFEHILEVINVLDTKHTVESYVEYCLGLSSTTQFFTEKEHHSFMLMLQRVEDEDNDKQ